jgi:acyl transferase domain-containing protein
VGQVSLIVIPKLNSGTKYTSRANGYARGEGFAAIIMKTLSAAIADGDDIECVIAETAVNQDGRTKGLTVPSAAAQTTLIETTYAKAGLDLTEPSDRPQYFEAHGTGTPAGDPIEAQAIRDAFFKSSEYGSALGTLHCGSVKTVIGHTEGTAGLAGLIKASLAIKNSIIPPNLLFESLAPGVEPFYEGLRIPTAAIPWPALEPGSVRRASVNSFVGDALSNRVSILTIDRALEGQMRTVSWKTTILQRQSLPFCLCLISRLCFQQRQRKLC